MVISTEIELFRKMYYFNKREISSFHGGNGLLNDIDADADADNDNDDVINIVLEIWNFYSKLPYINHYTFMEIIKFLGAIINNCLFSLESKDISYCFLRNILKLEFSPILESENLIDIIANNHSNWFKEIIKKFSLEDSFHLIIKNCYSSSSSSPFLPSLNDWNILFSSFNPLLPENEGIVLKLIEIPFKIDDDGEENALFLYLFPPIKFTYSKPITKLLFISFLNSFLKTNFNSRPSYYSPSYYPIQKQLKDENNPLTKLILHQHDIFFTIIEDLFKECTNHIFKDRLFSHLISRFHDDLNLPFKERFFSLFLLPPP